MNPQDNQSAGKQSTKNPMAFVAIALVVLLVIFGIVGYINSQKSKDTSAVNGSDQLSADSEEGKASIYLEPSQSEVSVGDTLTLDVNVDTQDQPISTVQAELNYPSDLFDFVNIDDTGSAFDTSVIKTGKDGNISIVRAQIAAGGVTGKALLAKITLKAKAPGEAPITFNDKTVIVKADEASTNITGTPSGGTYIIR